MESQIEWHLGYHIEVMSTAHDEVNSLPEVTAIMHLYELVLGCFCTIYAVSKFTRCIVGVKKGLIVSPPFLISIEC